MQKTSPLFCELVHLRIRRRAHPINSGAVDMRCLDDSDGAELVVNQLVGTYRIYQFQHGKVEHI
jgi:hypothetical protein